jgi:hypothetical protein
LKSLADGPAFSETLPWVPVDKNEGVVKPHLSCAVFLHCVVARELEDKELWKSHGQSLLGETVPPTIDTV